MSVETQTSRYAELQETIQMLQDELAATNQEILLLTVELEERVENRTAELKAAQEQLQRKNKELLNRSAELEAANKELEAFTSSVSHDLRAPLRHIEAYANLALTEEEPNLTDAVRDYLKRITGAATHMSQLIEDLLTFSRTARAELVRVPFKMGELVQDVLRELADDMKDRNIQWEIQELPQVQADPSLFRQVWVNLLSNAIKYTRPRDPAKILIKCTERAEEWEFSVQDNGVGFDMRYAQKLFGIFHRLHSSRDFEGTGVGLANVHRIVTRHGGRIWADAKPAKGASFFFTLPRT